MDPAIKPLDNMSASEWAGIAAMTSGLKEERVLDVKTLAEQIIEKDFYELINEVAEKYPKWAEENGFDKSQGTSNNDARFYGYMRESVCEYLADTAKDLMGGFVMDKSVYSGVGSVYSKDSLETEIHLSVHDLATEIIENCIETVLDDNNIDIPDEDRTGEEGESNIYGQTFSDLCGAIENHLAEAFEPLKAGIDRIEEPEYEYLEKYPERDK